jgi:hypothetical protein
MARYLLLTGAGIFLLFGCAHGILALRDLWLPRTFTPTDDSVRHAMQDSRVAINPHTNVWDAWRWVQSQPRPGAGHVRREPGRHRVALLPTLR